MVEIKQEEQGSLFLRTLTERIMEKSVKQDSWKFVEYQR